ncbi:MAG: SIMPL domain-containing protein [Gemmatimonadota bacterium]|nr:SIMPL domain-containing protein [Gemmatimonadota bacterium]
MAHPPIPTISASASADAKFTPDRATVSIAVQTHAATAAVAAAENARRQTAVLSTLRGLGMTNNELSTTGYSVSPEYKYSPNNSPTLTGYTVTNTVLADVRDISQIGKVLDSAVGSGSNSVSSLDFYASNTDAARQQAIAQAVSKAHANADVAAHAAGGTLGPMIHMSIGGGGSPPPRPMYMARSMVAEAAPQTPINPGQQSVTVSVSADWQFVPGR